MTLMNTIECPEWIQTKYPELVCKLEEVLECVSRLNEFPKIMVDGAHSGKNKQQNRREVYMQMHLYGTFRGNFHTYHFMRDKFHYAVSTLPLISPTTFRRYGEQLLTIKAILHLPL